MTENLRKRVSKWDVETDTYGNDSSEIRQDYLLSQKSDVSLKHQETNLDWNSSKCDIDNFSKYTVVEGTSTMHLSDSSAVEQFPEYVTGSSIKTFNDSSKISECPKHCDMEIDLEDDSKKSHREPISENKNKAKGGSDREAEGRGAALDRPYRRNMSPGVHRQRRRSWSSSPRSRRDRSHRSWSRSNSRGRSKSRSWSRSQSRSRSRSPSYRSRRGSERWVGRQRVVSRGSEPCRDFTTGRCRRGSQCRFVHDDGRKHYEKHSSRGTSEKGDGKAGLGRSSGYDNKDSISSLPEERDYSHYKLSHRYENQYDGDQKKSELHNRSSERCYDFTKGRCQRGSVCRFVHHDAASQSGLHAEDEAKEKKHRRRDADASFQQRIESHKVDDTPCKFFAEGHCHRGDVCRFSHQDMAHAGSKEKLRSGNRLGQDVIVLGVSNSGDRSAHTYLSNSSHQMSAAAKGVSMEFIGEDPHHPKYTNPMENNYENLPQEAPQRPLPSQLHNGAPITSEQHQQVAAVPTQSMPESTSVQQLSGMKGDIPAHGDGSGVIPFPGNSLGQTGNHHSVTHPLQDQNFTPNAQIQQVVPSFSSSGQTQQVSYPLPLNQFIGLQVPSTSQNFNIGLQSQAVRPSPHIGQIFQSPMLGLQGQQNLRALQNGQIQQNYNLSGQNQQRLPTPYVGNNQQKVNLNGKIQHNIPLPPHIPHGQLVLNQIVPSQPSVPLIYDVQGKQRHDFSSQSQQSLPPPQNLQIRQYAHGLNGQHQHVALQPPPNTRNLKTNEQSHQNSHQQMQTGGDKLLLNVDIPTKPSESNSDTTITPKEVTSEQAVQISNLSASLAQFFGSGQNLPQLYATLKPLSVVGSAPSPFLNPASTRPVAPAAIPTISILPGQGSLVQQHQDSASGSIEPLRPDTTNAPPGFSANSLEQKDGGDLHQPGIPEVEQAEVIANTEIKEVNETQTVQSKKEQATRSEDADPEIKTDGENKKGKDAKGTRMFKCALVEFVKDLLKPHWKEGLLSKEVHKTIVKKVVDKVTVVMQSGTVPQTPEKIDHYLTHSKPKLSKLVQAYMDKYG